MEVNNGTGQAADFRVTGGGGTGITPIPWVKIMPGQRVRHPSPTRGPWKVHFRLAGQRKTYSAVAYSSDLVELIEAKSTDSSYAVVVHSEAVA